MPENYKKILFVIAAVVVILLGGYLLGSHHSEKRDAALRETLERQLSQKLSPLEQKMQSFDASLGQVRSQLVTPAQVQDAVSGLNPIIRKNVEDAVKRYGVKPEEVASAVGRFNFTGSGSATDICDASKGEYTFRVKPAASPYAVTKFTAHCTPNAKANLTLNLKTRFDHVVLAQDPSKVGFLKTSLTSIQFTDFDGNYIGDAALDPSSSFQYSPDAVPLATKRWLFLGTYSNTGYGVGAYRRLKTWPIYIGGGVVRGTGGHPNEAGIGIGIQF